MVRVLLVGAVSLAHFSILYYYLFKFVFDFIMKVLVGVKRVVDYAVKVRVTKGTVDLASVKQSMNPFCEVGRSTGYVVFGRQRTYHKSYAGILNVFLCLFIDSFMCVDCC